MEEKESKEMFGHDDAPQEQKAMAEAEEKIEATAEEEPVKLTESEEIETEWARTLHVDYDAEEARKRAEAVQQSAATPPPVPGHTPPPMPEAKRVPKPFESAYGTKPTPPQPAGDAPKADYGHPEPMPKTYLVWAVLSMVLCCFIPGLVALIYSTTVTSKYYARDYEGARRASEITQYWIIASIVLGVVSMTMYLPIALLVN